MSHWFIENLQRFNRKERYWLLKTAAEDPFQLSENFRSRLGKKLGFTVPEGAHVFMDYHMNWIYAALQSEPKQLLGRKEGKKENPFGLFCLPGKKDEASREDKKKNPKVKLEKKRLIEPNQEDVDLLVAFPYSEGGRDGARVILIEAKADTSWSTGQFRRKARRLHSIFGCDCGACKSCSEHAARRVTDVFPSFVLMSPALKKKNEQENPTGFTESLLNWPPHWEAPSPPETRDSIADIPKWFFLKELKGDSKTDAVGQIAWLKLETPEDWLTVKRTNASGRSWLIE